MRTFSPFLASVALAVHEPQCLVRNATQENENPNRNKEAYNIMSATPFNPLPANSRVTYSAIVNRPRYRWPNGAGLAVYIGFNLEHFAFGEGLGAKIGTPCPEPDVLNYSWREYGNRVGAWRCLELFDSLAFLPTQRSTTIVLN